MTELKPIEIGCKLFIRTGPSTLMSLFNGRHFILGKVSQISEGWGPFTAFTCDLFAKDFLEDHEYELPNVEVVLAVIAYEPSEETSVWLPSGIRTHLCELPRGTVLANKVLPLGIIYWQIIEERVH
jgi:hypothetical protein